MYNISGVASIPALSNELLLSNDNLAAAIAFALGSNSFPRIPYNFAVLGIN